LKDEVAFEMMKQIAAYKTGGVEAAIEIMD